MTLADLVATNAISAPRVTQADIDATLDQNVDPAYYTFPTGDVTICMLTLRSGAKVTGVAATEEVAFRRARAEVRPFNSYALRGKSA